jgi:hypothetical protein
MMRFTKMPALVCFSIGFFLLVTEKQAFAQSERFNYGFKIGLNALSATRYDTYYAGESTSGGAYANQNGYSVGAFFRVNYSKLFLQPELAWNYNQQKCGFMIPNAGNADSYSFKALDINMDAVNTNLLLGYDIVRNKPFLFSAYAGASLKWTYKIQYKISEEHDYSGESDLFCYAGILGFSVNIFNLYCDFRYEINQPNTNLDFNDIPDIPDAYKGVFLDKNENILSFSIGMMF